jgi:invasion protein IalB
MKPKVVWCGVLIAVGPLLLTLAGIDALSAAPSKPGEVYAQVSPGGSTTEKKPTAPAEASPAGPGWAVNCKSEVNEKGLECRMSQTVVLKQSGQVLTNVTFRNPGWYENAGNHCAIAARGASDRGCHLPSRR